MLRTHLHKSISLRLALGFAGLFVLAYLGVGLLALNLITRGLEARVRNLVAETSTVIESAFGSGDVNDLRETVRSYAVASPGGDRLFLLTNAQGTRLAGNLSAGAQPAGWRNLSARQLGVPGSAQFWVYTKKVGGNFLTVAMSDKDTAYLRGVAFYAFGLTSIVVLIFAVLGGILVGYRTQRRLDLISETLDAVSRGDLSARVALSARRDEFDRLGERVNAALSRLETLVESVRQVSADIAHELRSPLNRLALVLDQAKAELVAGEDPANSISEAEAECFRVSETFEALLRIAQLEGGARREHFQALDLANLLGELAETYREVASEEGHVFSAPQTFEGPVMVEGDPELLLQLFANLIENALNHTPPGTEIGIVMQREKDRVRVEVFDSGRGIPPSEREKVFTRLYRLDHSRSTPGSGLGLSLVKAIVDLHGGVISLLDNRPGLRVVVQLNRHTNARLG